MLKPTDTNFRILTADQAEADDDLRRREAAKIHLNEALEKSKAYTTFLIGAGYGGFFALWSGFSGKIPAPATLLSGSLVGISLVVFVVWELAGTVLRSRHTLRMSQIFTDITDPNFYDKVHEANLWGAQAQLRLNLFWPTVFIFTSALGIAGSVLLSWNAFASVTHLPAWPTEMPTMHAATRASTVKPSSPLKPSLHVPDQHNVLKERNR